MKRTKKGQEKVTKRIENGYVYRENIKLADDEMAMSLKMLKAMGESDAISLHTMLEIQNSIFEARLRLRDCLYTKEE